MNCKRSFNLTRREFCAAAGGTLASLTLETACRRAGGSDIGSDGRLSVRPRSDVKTTATGRIMLGVDTEDRERDAILEIPKNSGASPIPLLVMLHGAGQNAEGMFGYLDSAHEEAGVAVLAPNSRDRSWDAIRGSFGPDIEFLNRALERVFATAAIDPARIAVGGFSDGASYALSLGLINGDVFNRIVAFSPGFVIDGALHGKPHIFISHGRRDHILPIDSCSRRIVAGLKARGYDITFREFDGDHEIPPEIARAGMSLVAAS